MENKSTEDNELNSLESLEGNSEQETNSGSVVPPTAGGNKGPRLGIKGRIRNLISHFNIYLLLFMLIVVIASGFTLISIQRNKKVTVTPSINTQPLSPEALNKLNTTDTKVGDPKQTLSVESNAIFAGKVLIRDSLDVAGTIKVGGALSLSGLSVAGTSTFDQIQTNKLTVAGDSNIQGQFTVQKGLTVSGGASFGGPISAPQLTVQSFQLSGDLQLQRHIDAGGATPGKADGGKLGSGGTSSVSGTDTAGTVAINLGGSPPVGDGCFVTISFAQKFNATPHIVITPVGANAAALNYYITRTTSSFQICATNTSSGSFAFDYTAID